MFKNMKIRGKLLLGFIILLVIMVVLAIFGIYFITRISNDNTYALENPSARYDMLNYQATDIMELRRLATAMAFNIGNHAELSAAERDILRVRAHLREQLDAYQESLDADDRLDRARVDYMLNVARQLDAYVMRYINEVIDPMYAVTMAAADQTKIAGLFVVGGEIFGEIDSRFEFLIDAIQARLVVEPGDLAAIERYQLVSNMATDIMNLRRLATAMAFNVGNQAELSAAEADIIEVRMSLRDILVAYQTNLHQDDGLTTARRNELLTVAGELEHYVLRYVAEVIDPMYSVAVAAADQEEIARLFALGGEIAAQMYERFDYLMESAQNTLVEIDESTAAMATTSMVTMVALTIVGVVLGVAVALVIASMVTKPIQEVSKIIESVSDGNIAINFKTNLGRDEVGVMTQNTYNMVNTIKSMVEDLIQLDHGYNTLGDIDYRIDATKYNNSFREMIEGVNNIPDKIVEDVLILTSALGEINKGNFDISVPDLPGKKMVLPNSVRATVANIQSVNDGLNAMIEAAAVKGELNYKIDASKYEGGWRELMVGLNNLAAAVDAPLTEIGSVMENLSRGDFSATVSGSYAGDFLRLKESVNTTIAALSAYINEITDTLTKVSDGDLTTSITRDYVGSFSAIKDALNNISRSLNKTMSEISSASEQVLSGAKQISSSSMDLANGASTQASSVQELNASVDLINQQTKQNADNAAEANTLSQTSTDNAREGNSAMQQTLGAMNQIKDSSNNISKIIKTIQDIAFQTNLLALNAAVEAARAGEHGKGFAVVAEEVRSLAARSQQAASETTELIGTSINTVERGSEIAQSTAETLNTIVDNANKVQDIVGNISTSSQEQAEAISQVVMGLQQISQVVQSNSAVSEEAAAASEELNSQAEVLQQLVSFFKL